MTYFENHLVDQAGQNLLDSGHHVPAEADLAPRVEGDGRVVGRDKLCAGSVDRLDGNDVDDAGVAVLLETELRRKWENNQSINFIASKAMTKAKLTNLVQCVRYCNKKYCESTLCTH